MRWVPVSEREIKSAIVAPKLPPYPVRRHPPGADGSTGANHPAHGLLNSALCDQRRFYPGWNGNAGSPVELASSSSAHLSLSWECVRIAKSAVSRFPKAPYSPRVPLPRGLSIAMRRPSTDRQPHGLRKRVGVPHEQPVRGGIARLPRRSAPGCWRASLKGSASGVRKNGSALKQQFVEGLASSTCCRPRRDPARHIYHAAGLPGSIIAGVCFILPAFLIMLLLMAAYGPSGAHDQSAFYGIGPVVVGIFAAAIHRLAKAQSSERSQIVLLVAAAAAVCSLRRRPRDHAPHGRLHRNSLFHSRRRAPYPSSAYRCCCRVQRGRRAVATSSMPTAGLARQSGSSLPGGGSWEVFSQGRRVQLRRRSMSPSFRNRWSIGSHRKSSSRAGPRSTRRDRS